MSYLCCGSKGAKLMVCRHFGPSLSPLLQVGFRGVVETDASFRANMLSLDDYKATCGQATWNCVMQFREKLRERNVRMAFFSSTPQGGGVALMRHALVRFSRLAGVNLSWYGKLLQCI